MKNMIKKLALIGTMALGTLALAQASDTQTLSIKVDTLEELVVVAGKTQSDSLTDSQVIKAGNYQKDFDTVLPVKPPPEGTGPRSTP
jgi:hypothetical protein